MKLISKEDFKDKLFWAKKGQVFLVRKTVNNAYSIEETMPDIHSDRYYVDVNISYISIPRDLVIIVKVLDNRFISWGHREGVK